MKRLAWRVREYACYEAARLGIMPDLREHVGRLVHTDFIWTTLQLPALELARDQVLSEELNLQLT